MTIFRSHVYRDKRLDEFRSTSGQVLGATLQETLETNPVASAVRAGEFANALYGEPLPDVGVSEFGMDIPRAAPDSPIVPFDMAQERVKQEGLDLKKFDIPDEGIPERALNMLIKWRKEDRRRADIYERSPGGFTLGAAQLAVALGGSAVDPLNIAASFIPVAGPVRTAARLARIESRLGRAALRARVGAIEGAVGAAVVEPAVLASQRYTQSDYDLWDSMLNIALGTALGGGLHAGIGAIADAGSIGGRVEPVGLAAERIRKASPQTQETALRTSVAQAASGRNVEVTPIFDADARMQTSRVAINAARGELPSVRLPDNFRTEAEILSLRQRMEEKLTEAEIKSLDKEYTETGLPDKGINAKALSEIERPLVLYRGTVGRDPLDNTKFVSTSNRREVAESYGSPVVGLDQGGDNIGRIAELHVEPGVRAFVPDSGIEHEVVLAPGTRYSILGETMETAKNGEPVRVLKVRASPEDSPSARNPQEAQKTMQRSYEPENSRMADRNAARDGDEDFAAIPDDDAMPEETLTEVMDDVDRLARSLDATDMVKSEMEAFNELDRIAEEYGYAARALGDCQLNKGSE